MTYENFIGLRYLMSKRRSRVLSVITMISVAGVALGVTAMIVVLSVMGGFKKDLKKKILGTKAHIVVKTANGEPMQDPGEVMDRAGEVEAIIGTSPYIQSEVMVSSPSNLKGVVLRGIDPDKLPEVSEIPDEVVDGEFEHLRTPSKAKRSLSGLGGSRGSLLKDIERTKERIERAKKDIDNAEKRLGDGGSEGGSSEGDADPSSMEPIVPESADESSGKETEEDGGAGGMPSVTGEEDGETELPGLIIGKELSKSLHAGVGDEVNVVTPQGEMGPTGPIPRSRPFRVVGVFYTGMYEYDANYAYTTLEAARDFLDQTGVTGVEMKTVHVEKAMPSADTLDAKLDERFDVLDWKELNESLFYALKLEKIAMFVVLIFIVLVASFSIIAMLIMIVLEKSRDIAVMKSMGMTDGGVMRVFMFQGVVIGAVGAVIGLLLGLGICWFLIEFGFRLDSEVYYISQLPVDINPVEVTVVVVCTILISFVATIYPSWKASKLRPVEGLRYE